MNDAEIIASRNAQLEAENRELYQKINDLLTENTALKASRAKFREVCQSYVESQTTNILTPTKEMNQKIYRQTREIDSLKQKLADAEQALQAHEQEKARVIEEKTALEYQAEKEEATSQQSKVICHELIRSIKSLQRNLSGINEDDQNYNSGYDDNQLIESSLQQYIEKLQTSFRELSLECAKATTTTNSKTNEIQELKRQISELETKIIVLNTENAAAKECNDRYEEERTELTNAITSLRNALKATKETLVSVESANKALKEENVQLRIKLGGETDLHEFDPEGLLEEEDFDA